MAKAMRGTVAIKDGQAHITLDDGKGLTALTLPIDRYPDLKDGGRVHVEINQHDMLYLIRPLAEGE